MTMTRLPAQLRNRSEGDVLIGEALAKSALDTITVGDAVPDGTPVR